MERPVAPPVPYPIISALGVGIVGGCVAFDGAGAGLVAVLSPVMVAKVVGFSVANSGVGAGTFRLAITSIGGSPQAIVPVYSVPAGDVFMCAVPIVVPAGWVLSWEGSSSDVTLVLSYETTVGCDSAV